MNNIDSIKNKIKMLYETNPKIHINIQSTRPKLILNNVYVIIKGVYPNIFCVEELGVEHPKTFSFQYVDILIGKIEISELKTANNSKSSCS